MSLTLPQIDALAQRVWRAQTSAQAIPKLTLEYPDLTVAESYQIQSALRRLYEGQGHKVVGWKAGLTSRAKMRQMGVSVPSVGFLTDRMARPENSAIETADMVHPRVECEVGFVLSKPLCGPHCTREQVLDATAFVLPSIEVIDSRYVDFKFDLPSVIADNSSSARFIGGGRYRRPAELDLRTLGVVMEINGEVMATSASAAVMGHPADAVALLVNLVGELGENLPTGSFIMSGGITEAFAVKPGDHVQARFQELGSVAARFV
jgi:2-oxo-3-hexenedioate decarboxylase